MDPLDEYMQTLSGAAAQAPSETTLETNLAERRGQSLRKSLSTSSRVPLPPPPDSVAPALDAIVWHVLSAFERKQYSFSTIRKLLNENPGEFLGESRPQAAVALFLTLIFRHREVRPRAFPGRTFRISASAR